MSAPPTKRIKLPHKLSAAGLAPSSTTARQGTTKKVPISHSSCSDDAQQGSINKLNLSLKAQKTPFQKHKEALAAKRKKEQEDTAAAYADFVESFAEEKPQSVSFMRGGTIAQGYNDPTPVVQPGAGAAGRYTLGNHAAGSVGSAAAPVAALCGSSTEVKGTKQNKKRCFPKSLHDLWLIVVAVRSNRSWRR